MQIKSFQYFISIVENKSLSAAAQALYISQPALSQHIKKLEDELNVTLFKREGHFLTLTQAGEIFLRNSKNILRDFGNMQKEFELLHSGDSESVRFGISPFYSQHYLPKLLPSIITKYPGLKIDIVEDISTALERKLIDGDLDFCTLPLLPKNDLLEYEAIYHEEILLAVAHDNPLNAGYPQDALKNHNFPYINLSRVRGESFITLKKIQKFSHMGLRLCEDAGFIPTTICETMNWETVHMLVSSGLGVGFIPSILAGQIPASAEPPCYYRIDSNSYRAYAIATRPGSALSAPAQILVDGFRKFFQELRT